MVSAVAGYLLWRRARNQGLDATKRLLRTGLVLAVAGGVFLGVRGYVIWINGGPHEMARATHAMALATAEAGFKPAERPGAAPTRAASQLRDHCVAFHEMFLSPWHWAQVTAATSVGLYGYMTARGSFLYYLAFFALLALFALTALRLGLAGPSPGDRGLPVMVPLFCGVVLLAAAYHSWVSDFQPQGRYLFPALPVLGLLMHCYREALSAFRLAVIAWAIFGLSVYSFLFVGLAQLPKS
jgi:hypothetical protein